MAGRGLRLQLGDIINIVAPGSDELGAEPMIVRAFGDTWVRMQGRSGRAVDLRLNDDGGLEDETIESIELLSRADEPGYAAQNGLLPGSWVNIRFGGDVPMIVTGKIVNLDGDQIEVKTIDGGMPLFIDFAYRGIPEDIPIEAIDRRDGPPKDQAAAQDGVPSPSGPADSTPGEPPKAEDEDGDGEFAPLPVAADEAPLREEELDADDIVIGAQMEAVSQVVDVPEAERRFGLDRQTTDMLDDLLSSLTTEQRTDAALARIHTMIERYTQLRSTFSTYESDGAVAGAVVRGPKFKPMAERISKLEDVPVWALPVTANRKKLFGGARGERTRPQQAEVEAAAINYDDVIAENEAETRAEEGRIISAYTRNLPIEGTTRYEALERGLARLNLPWASPGSGETGIIETSHVRGPVQTVVENESDFKSTAIVDNGVGTKQYFVQPHAKGLDVLSVTVH